MDQGYRVNGLASLSAKLKKLPILIKKEAINAIEDAADLIVVKAVARVPVDFGVLKQSIDNQQKNQGLKHLLVNKV